MGVSTVACVLRFAVEVQRALCVQAQTLWAVITQFLKREGKKPSPLVIVKIVIGFPVPLPLILLLHLLWYSKSICGNCWQQVVWKDKDLFHPKESPYLCNCLSTEVWGVWKPNNPKSPVQLFSLFFIFTHLSPRQGQKQKYQMREVPLILFPAW